MTVGAFKEFIAALNPEWDTMQIEITYYDDEYMRTEMLDLDVVRADIVPGWNEGGPSIVLTRHSMLEYHEQEGFIKEGARTA